MTDTDVNESGDWLPGIGWLDMEPERVELIKGLYRLAAWVAEHRDLPMPRVDAVLHTRHRASWDERCAQVDQVAEALDVEVRHQPGHCYEVESRFGPVLVQSYVYAPAAVDETTAALSYRGNVTPDRTSDEPATAAAPSVANRVVADRLGHSGAAATAVYGAGGSR